MYSIQHMEGKEVLVRICISSLTWPMDPSYIELIKLVLRDEEASVRLRRKTCRLLTRMQDLTIEHAHHAWPGKGAMTYQ